MVLKGRRFLVVFCWGKLLPLEHERAFAWRVFLTAHAIFFLFLWSWMRAIFSDPGFIYPLQSLAVESDEGGGTCRKCEPPLSRPLRARHCSRCQRCVARFDHHCPFINNCVGLMNHKFFLLSLFYITLLLFFGVGCIHKLEQAYPPTASSWVCTI